MGSLRRCPIRTLWVLLLLSTLLAAGCGGGGDDGPPVNLPPQLSNLQLSQDTFDLMSGTGRRTLSASVNYTDREADIVSIRVDISDGSSLTVPVGMLPASTGQLVGQFEFSTLVSGVFSAVVWAIDRAGNSSNRLTTTITIVGSSQLADLSLSAIAFDQTFLGTVHDYTATVNAADATTTLRATTEDPNSVITVNGTNLPSSGTSELLALDVGINEISVVVTTIDGSKTANYNVSVLRNALDLIQRVYIKASNTDFDDFFGESIVMEAGTLVVASRLEDSDATGVNGNQADNSMPNAGAVYVFTGAPAGIWSQRAYLKASNPDAHDNFGAAVDLDGDTLFVGAFQERSAATGVNGDQADNSAPGAGAVYLFVRDLADEWVQESYLKASNSDAGDLFGSSIAVYGDTLIVGAAGEASSATGVGGNEADNAAEFAGAVYVFARDSNGEWAQVAYIKASDTDSFDQFGSVVSMDGDTLVVSAPERALFTGGDPSGETGGKVYLFTRDGSGVWTQRVVIQPGTVARFHRFGAAVAIEGDTLAIGAPDTDATGAVYVFSRDAGGSWILDAQLSALNTDSRTVGGFGSAVALREGQLLIGATEGAGGAYLFGVNDGGQWEQRAFIRADNREPGDAFGSAVVFDAGIYIVGAKWEDSAASGIGGNQAINGAPRSGAVYVFE